MPILDDSCSGLRFELASATWSERFRYAYSLGWLLHPNPTIASSIAVQSLVGAAATWTAQARRTEYTPKGAHRTRVTMDNFDHLVLRHVFAASVEYERKREDSGKITEEDLVVYFLKECVRLPMKNNAFHLIVSVGRILHNYSTRAVMNMYGAIAPQRAAKKNDEQCRKWKATIIDALETRFRRYVTPQTCGHAEKRFAPMKDPHRFSMLVKYCLSCFVPHRTPHVMENSDLHGPPNLDYEGEADGEHATEMLRFHAIICPHCFDRLTAAWDLASPGLVRTLPHFVLAGAKDEGSNDRRMDRPKLTERDVQTGLNEVQAEQERRLRISPCSLSVLVDGQKRGTLEGSSRTSAKITLDEQAEVVEIVARDQQILIRHLMNYSDTPQAEPESFEYTIGDNVFCVTQQQSLSDPTFRTLDIKVVTNVTNPDSSVVLAPNRAAIIAEIDEVTSQQARLHAEFVKLAIKHKVPVEPVPHVHRRHEVIARRSAIICGATAAASALVLLFLDGSNRSTFFPIVLFLELVDLVALIGWWRFNWSSRLVLSYRLKKLKIAGLNRSYLGQKRLYKGNRKISTRQFIWEYVPPLAAGYSLLALILIVGAWTNSDIKSVDDAAGVAVGRSGDLYVLDGPTGKIVDLTQSNGSSTFLINALYPSKYPSNHGTASAIAVDSSGSVFVAYSGTNRVQLYDPALSSWRSIQFGHESSSEGWITYSLRSPGGLAVDSSGNLYVADTGNNRVVRASITQESGGATQYRYDSQGNLLAVINASVAQESDGLTEYSYDSQGNRAVVWAHGYAHLRGLSPRGVAIDSNGALYVADVYNNRILVWNSTEGGVGALSMQGGTGTYAFTVNLSRPSGVAVDGLGHLYVTDTGNHRVLCARLDGESASPIQYVYDGNGNRTVHSDVLSLPALTSPESIAADASGNVYVTDTGTNHVYLITASGAVTRVTARDPINESVRANSRPHNVNWDEKTGDLITETLPVRSSSRPSPSEIAEKASRSALAATHGNAQTAADRLRAGRHSNFVAHRIASSTGVVGVVVKNGTESGIPVLPTATATVNDQAVTVKGSNFQAGLTVDVFNGSGTLISNLSGSQIQSLTANSFTMLINVGSGGSFGIEVVNPGNDRSAPFKFTATARQLTPTVNGINPSAATGGDQAVTVSGSNVQEGCGSPCSITASGSSTTVVGQAILATGTFTVTLKNNTTGLTSGGVSLTVSAGTSAPVINSIAVPPNPLVSGQAFTITLNGSNFDASNSTAFFTGPGCGSACSIGAIGSSTQVAGQAISAAGRFTVTLKNNSTELTSGGVSSAAIAPVINSISTSPSPPVSGQAFTITFNGMNFDASNSTVFFTEPGCGSPCGISAIGSSTQVGGQAIHVAESFTVTLKNNSTGLTSGGVSVSSAAVAPVINSISTSPNQSVSSQSFTVTLNENAANPR